MADITNDRSRIIYNNEGQAIFGGSSAVIWVNPAAGSHAGVNFRQDGTFKGFVGFNNSSSCVNLSRDGSIADGINVDASHNVGIGVTSMGHKLDVSGNIRLQGGDRKIVFNNGSVETSLDQMAGGVGGLGTLGRFGVATVAPNNTLQVVGNITVGTGTTNEAVRTIMTGGTINLQATDANHRIIIRGTQSTDGTITGNSNNMDFYEFGGYNFYTGVNTGTGARTLALSIASDGDATFAGEVVIQGSSHSTFKIKSGNNDNILFAQAIQSDNARIGTDTNTPLSFFTNQAERMRIDNSGNVGIGTTSPGVKLHVHATSGDGLIRVTGDNIINSGGTIKGFNNGLAFNIAPSGGGSETEAIRIIGNGNVGIGTTSATYRLQVHDDNEDILKLHNTTDGLDSLVTFTNPGGTLARIQGLDNGGLQIDTGNNAGGLNTNVIHINNSGNVGISQTSIGHKLDVNGDARFVSNSSSRVLTLLQQGNNNGNIIQFQNHNGGNVWELVGRNNQFYIYNNALTAHALFINPSNSNIGIGNTSPSQKLHVTGSILASSDVVAFSDKKLKENIKTLDGSKVYNMRGVSFTRKDTGKDSSGVIAQEIQKIAPELVTDNDGTLSVAYGNLTGYLIEAVKELKTEVEQLKKQIKNGNSV